MANTEPNPEELLSPKQVSEILGVKVSTLEKWRVDKSQPLRYLKIGRFVKYKRCFIDEYLNAVTVSCTG